MAKSFDKDVLQCNKPKRTPGHPKKSHVVKGCEGGKEKLIRFGEQGADVAGKPKSGESDKMKKKRKSFHARHKCDQQTSKHSAAYWSCRERW